VFPSRRKVILVHGCFWHRHDCALGRKTPRARPEYWLPKLARNHARDELNLKRIEAMGWKALVIWECELRKELQSGLGSRLSDFLDG
jgi:DNA mismatch endonuclease, patch repair protein